MKIFALALIHHLRITFGIPLKKQFELFSSIAKYLIIEFVDKEDSQIHRLLQNREDVFDDYQDRLDSGCTRYLAREFLVENSGVIDF